MRHNKTGRNCETLSFPGCLLCMAGMLLILLLCVCLGSVNVPLRQTLGLIWARISRNEALEQSIGSGTARSIILTVRLPRVLCAAVSGASLSICGGAMQGLLKNPLADGSTLGVSSGAALGAALAIAFGFRIPFLGLSATAVCAMVCAFLSLLLVMALAFRLDHSLSTNTIILLGVIYSMFISSILTLVITFASDRLKHITYWTMGSFAGSNYRNVWFLLAVTAAGSAVLIHYARELNAFAIGEENARQIGVNVRRVRLIILLVVSAQIGVCVSISGTIGFVGLVIPHMVRMVLGPNHKKLLPVCLFAGASFLMLADLAARVLLNPLELPIGAITSFVGSILFVFLFYRTRQM